MCCSQSNTIVEPSKTIREDSEPSKASSGVRAMGDVKSRSGPPGTVDILFVGTGVSLGVPNMGHVVKGNCSTCMRAWKEQDSKDRRNNVSIAVLVNGTHKDERGHGRECVLVDAGKTMRDAVMRQFPKEGIEGCNALVLTHDHADAILGLDDLRDLQHKELVGGGCFCVPEGPTDVYLSHTTMKGVTQQFPYLTGSIPWVDKERHIVQRSVTLLDFHVLDTHHDSFNARGVPFRALPLLHGGDYVCLGFSIGAPGEFVYLSDVKTIPEESMTYLQSLPKIKVLVLDCLSDHAEGGHYSHMGLTEALQTVELLCPDRCLLVGMCCSVSPHQQVNDRLVSMGYPHVQLAYDGQVIRGIPIQHTNTGA